MGHASKRRELLVGTDQRITSGPAATAAASRQRQASKRKQAGYMAAPERFAETSDFLLHRGRRPYMALRDRLQCSDFESGFGAFRTWSDFRRARNLERMTLAV